MKYSLLVCLYLQEVALAWPRSKEAPCRKKWSKVTRMSKAMEQYNQLANKSRGQDYIEPFIHSDRSLEAVTNLCQSTALDCSDHGPSMFRSMDGTCNNLQSPFQGAAHIPLTRHVESIAEDWDKLPNARLISTTVHGFQNRSRPDVTHMFVIFGQFLDHDISLSPESHVEGCCANPAQAECLPIQVPENDPFFSEFDTQCLELTRSVPHCFDGTGAREPMNVLTAFIDGSMIYGNGHEDTNNLRLGQDGYLKHSSQGAYEMLPEEGQDFFSGDERVMENPALTTLHTIFMREHNRIAREIITLEDSLSDEGCFQITRRILGAELQNIVYTEFLPTLLSPAVLSSHGLDSDSLEASNYDPETDPSVQSAFSTAAFRFGHTMVEDLMSMVHTKSNDLIRPFMLKDNFFNASLCKEAEGEGVEQIVAGLIQQPAQDFDRFVVPTLTNFLFPAPGAAFGSDLLARNIMRGRDHGIGKYNDYRTLCRLKALTSWELAPSEIGSEAWVRLKTVYDHPDDIELFSGGLAEMAPSDGVTGPTFQCLIARQFQALKDGDRYFYTHTSQAGSFKPNQRDAIKSRRFSDIVCDNTKIRAVKEDIFKQSSPLMDCGQRRKIPVDMFMPRSAIMISEMSTMSL